MSFSPYDPTGIFDLHISAAFLEDSVRCLFDSYQRVHQECKSRFPWQEAHDVRPILRRADFEYRWRMVAQRYSGMIAEVASNNAKNCFHTRIKYGQVIITQSYVDAYVKTIRKADFRDGYARSDAAYLFPDMNPPAPAKSSPVYAVMMHDSDPMDPSRPHYVDIVFPNPLGGPFLARIKLAKRYPDLFAVPVVVAEEVVEDTLQPVLRKDAKQQRKSG